MPNNLHLETRVHATTPYQDPHLAAAWYATDQAILSQDGTGCTFAKSCSATDFAQMPP